MNNDRLKQQREQAMKLCIEVPLNYTPERDYILEVMLHDFLGLNYQIQRSNRRNVQITAGDGTKLTINDHLFQTSEDRWLTVHSLPQRPLKTWNTPQNLPGCSQLFREVPVIYGEDLSCGEFCQSDCDGIRLGLDIFGSAFFMLTRYEEAVTPYRDTHDRFPATASLAYKESFLDRPIVNEYLEILWACIRMLWPQFQRAPRQYHVMISHDVDKPLSVANKSWPEVLKNTAGDVFHRKDVWLPIRRLYARLASGQGHFDADPCNTFDFLMDISECHGLQDAFYFITDRSAGTIDGDYSIEMPWVRRLIQRIHARKHEIGLHPSYNTFRNSAQIKHEFTKLLETTEKDGIRQCQWGGRQHFLRWDSSTTWQIWADAGLSYDSTLSFADRTGFRCGVCYEYPTFNLLKRHRLQLRERPLIVMDRTLFGKNYMCLSPQAAKVKILELSKTCRKFNGDFTLLWHNSELLAGWQKRLYKEIVESVA